MFLPTIPAFSQGVTRKSILSLFSSFGKEEWSQTEVVGEIMFIPIFL